MHGQEHENYEPNRNARRDDDAPTFVLDVPVLNVDELDLEVNDLKAHVALRAELADFVKINVGVDVYLDKVKLGIKGLEAEALLTIQLDRVLGTLDRALEAIDNNPQILDRVAQDLAHTVRSAGRGPSQGAGEAEQDVDRPSQLERATDQADEEAGQTGDEAGRTVYRAGDESRNVTEPVSRESNKVEGEETTSSLADLQVEEEYIDDGGRIVGRARDESGNVVEEVLDEESDVLELGTPGEEDRETENEDDGQVDATDAARRKADKLGVKLSEVKGTGSGGRVLVKDVERAAK